VIAIPRGDHQPDEETLQLAAAVLQDVGELTPEVVHRFDG
jgi:hypothetical protein